MITNREAKFFFNDEKNSGEQKRFWQVPNQISIIKEKNGSSGELERWGRWELARCLVASPCKAKSLAGALRSKSSEQTQLLLFASSDTLTHTQKVLLQMLPFPRIFFFFMLSCTFEVVLSGLDVGDVFFSYLECFGKQKDSAFFC